MNDTTLTYLDIELAIEYEYLPGYSQSSIDPGEEPIACIDSISIGGVDITILVGDDHRRTIAQRVAHAHDDEAEDVRGEQFMNDWKGGQV